MDRVIWQYWETRGEKPAFVDGLRELAVKNSGVEVILVTPESLTSYLDDIRDEIVQIRELAHKADMIRTRLVHRYGGMWLDTDALVRFGLARFSTVLINMLVLVIALPFFLLREPANLLRNSLLCAATTIPAMLGALMGFAASLPGIPPSVSVFLPVLILLPVAMFMATLIKT